MKDQIPYLTKVHKLRDKFRLVFTQAIPRNISGWLAQRSEFRIRYLGKTAENSAMLAFVYVLGCVVFLVVFWDFFVVVGFFNFFFNSDFSVRLGEIGALD